MANVVPAGYSFVPGTGYMKTDDNSGPYAVDTGGTPILLGGTGTGGATAAKQDTGNASLSSIDGKLGVGGVAPVISTALTVTASSAYANGNVIGTLLTLTGAARVAGKGGLIQSVLLTSKSAQTFSGEVLFFNANPTNSTFTDKVALAVHADDLSKIIGTTGSFSWISVGTPSFGQAPQLAMPFQPASGTTIYAIVVSRGTPTFTTTSDLVLHTRILQD